MGRPSDCNCHCEGGACEVAPSCGGVRCTDRTGGIFRTALSHADVIDITPDLGDGNASGITVIDHANPDEVVVCNRAGDIYRSPDRGDNWLYQNLAAPLNDLHSRGRVVVTVGDGGVIFRSATAGETWTPITSPTGSHLLSVWMVSTSIGYACGQGGVLLKTTNGGLGWSVLTSGVAVELRSVHFFDKRHGFAVGASGTVIHTTDAGLTWDAVSGISDVVDCVLMLAVRDLDFNGQTDCSTNPNYPAAVLGDDYYVTVAGKIGGAAGKVVAVGDVYRATANNAGGTEAAVGASWVVDPRGTTGDAVMFARNGTATRKWTWDGMTLKDAGAGPTVVSGQPLRMCGITCNDGSNDYRTQVNGPVVAPYDAIGNPVVFYGSLDTIDTSSPTAQHQNRDGDASQYTASVKHWGGLTITDNSLTQDADNGFQQPCLKHHVEWSQTKPPPISFPQRVGPPATGFEPLFGGWVVYTLNGGPQVSLAARESLTSVSITANTKLVTVSPPSEQSFVRIIGTATAGTWTITVDGEETTALSITASLADVESAVGALDGVDGNVSVSGWPINTPTADPAIAVGLNNGCLYVLKWTDAVARTVSVNTGGLTFSGSNSSSSGSTLINWRYAIVPVVIRDSVVYGPPFFQQSAIDNDPDHLTAESNGGAVESCWSYLHSEPECTDEALDHLNYPLHSRYRELHNTTDEVLGEWSFYCRGEDGFGDWENASNVRVIHNTFTPAAQYNSWVPNTISFDSGDFTVGFAVGFVSDAPGDYSADLLLDNICLEWVTESAPSCGGDLVVDESFESLPGDWIVQDGLLYSCDTLGDHIYEGAEFRIENATLLTDDMIDGSDYSAWTGITPYFWRQTPYGGGSFRKVLELAADPRNTDFCLTVECELLPIHDRDLEWYDADQLGDPGNPTPLFDLNALRPSVEYGIYIGGLAKFGIERNLPAGFNGGGPFGADAYRLTVDGRIDQVGSVLTDMDDCDAGFSALYNNYYCTDGTIGFCGGPGVGCHAVPYGSHIYDTSALGASLAALPLATTRLRLEVRWAEGVQSVFDCLAQERFYVRAWINDRPIVLMRNALGAAVDVASGAVPAVVWQPDNRSHLGNPNQPAVGVYSHRGGRWRNFKAWIIE